MMQVFVDFDHMLRIFVAALFLSPQLFQKPLLLLLLPLLPSDLTPAAIVSTASISLTVFLVPSPYPLHHHSLARLPALLSPVLLPYRHLLAPSSSFWTLNSLLVPSPFLLSHSRRHHDPPAALTCCQPPPKPLQQNLLSSSPVLFHDSPPLLSSSTTLLLS
eukprot:767366-Hanusia_phi.AAC.2